MFREILSEIGLPAFRPGTHRLPPTCGGCRRSTSKLGNRPFSPSASSHRLGPRSPSRRDRVTGSRDGCAAPVTATARTTSSYPSIALRRERIEDPRRRAPVMPPARTLGTTRPTTDLRRSPAWGRPRDPGARPHHAAKQHAAVVDRDRGATARLSRSEECFYRKHPRPHPRSDRPGLPSRSAPARQTNCWTGAFSAIS